MNGGNDSSMTSFGGGENCFIVSGGKIINGTGSSWRIADWDGSKVSNLSSFDWEANYSADIRVYRPDSSLDIFVVAFRSSSNAFMINTYQYASGSTTLLNEFTLISSGAGVSIGMITGSGDDVVIGYEDDSKGYIASLSLDNTTKAVEATGISVVHNYSNSAVSLYGPKNTNEYTAVINTGGRVKSSVITINAYTTPSLQWIGVAQSGASGGNTASVALDGIASGFTGLTPGTKYYYNSTAYDGSISTVPSDYYIGTAISTTEISLNA
jgi:hypothetical protein